MTRNTITCIFGDDGNAIRDISQIRVFPKKAWTLCQSTKHARSLTCFLHDLFIAYSGDVEKGDPPTEFELKPQQADPH